MFTTWYIQEYIVKAFLFQNNLIFEKSISFVDLTKIKLIKSSKLYTSEEDTNIYLDAYNEFFKFAKFYFIFPS